MGNPVILSGPLLIAGIKNIFAKTFFPRYKGLADRIGKVMALEIPSDKRTELYGFPLNTLQMELWPKGSVISSGAFSSLGYSKLENAPLEITLPLGQSSICKVFRGKP